jgi:hypothetical protein
VQPPIVAQITLKNSEDNSAPQEARACAADGFGSRNEPPGHTHRVACLCVAIRAPEHQAAGLFRKNRHRPRFALRAFRQQMLWRKLVPHVPQNGSALAPFLSRQTLVCAGEPTLVLGAPDDMSPIGLPSLAGPISDSEKSRATQ